MHIENKRNTISARLARGQLNATQGARLPVPVMCVGPPLPLNQPSLPCTCTLAITPCMTTTRAAIQKHYTKHQMAPPHTASSCLPHKQKQIMRNTRIGSSTIINVVSRAKMRAGMSRALTACSWANLARSHAFTLDAPPPLWCLSPVPLGVHPCAMC